MRDESRSLIKEAKMISEKCIQAAKLYQFEVEEQDSELALTYTHTTLCKDLINQEQDSKALWWEDF